MKLKDYRIPSRDYTLSNGPDDNDPLVLTVHGLSFADLMFLATDKEYGGQVRLAWLAYNDVAKTKKAEGSSIATVATKFPKLLAAAIAKSIHQFDSQTIEQVTKLPFSDQLNILQDIFELTFAGEEGLKKTFGMIASALSTTKSLTPALVTVMNPPKS